MASGDKSKELKKYQKSYFDVLGICCSSEVPLIEKILKPLDGIKDVNVIVPSRTVIVVHDDLLISQIQIVKALNQASLEANTQVCGEEKYGKKWPSPYTMACGLLLTISFLKYFFHPLKWLALAAVVVGLPPIILRSIAAIRSFTLDINILALIAIGGTIALKDYMEAGTIVFLFTIAEWLESRASHKANAVMSSLMSMVPQKAVLAETGQVIDAKDVNRSTILAVKAGEIIPIDGIVVEGKCEVDEKTLTGESFPVAKQKQSNVWAGTINLNGYISVKTTALAEDCVVAKMVKLVEEAQSNKSKTQRLIDRCAKYYTPVVVLISVGIVAIPAALRTNNLSYWAHLALVILVSACPCALVLSTPVATFCAFTKAATTGLLIKGGDFLEILAKIKIMAFDKTGTITRGEFWVKDFRSLCPDTSLNTLLYWVSSIESKSSHPMAAALVDYGRLNFISPMPENVKEFQDFPGEGICGEIDGKNIYVGNRKIAVRAGCETVPTMEDDTKDVATIGYIFSGATPIGLFSLADACRSGVAEAINELKFLGIKTIMLTGDSHVAAMQAQDQIQHAIEVVHAELLPEEKVRIIKDLKKMGPTAMIGDGVNDAPALATTDIGISMGISGSALATETGHITLMSNDIRKIPQAICLARKTHWKIVENVGVSIFTKAVILALAISGHPIIWAAVLADVGTCLLVIFNSMFLLHGTNKHRRCQKSTCAPRGNAHSSCGGCKHLPHKNDDCGLNNPIQQQCCAHGDKGNTCEHDEEQMCASRNHCQPVHLSTCQKDGCNNSIGTHNGCLGVEGSTHSKHYDHTATTNDMASHVIQINNVANGDGDGDGEQTCKNHDRHRACARDSVRESSAVPCGVNNLLKCLEKSDQNVSHNHLLSVTCGANHVSELSESSEHEESSKAHHHHHHHHHVQVKSTTGCLQNEDTHVECRSESSEHEESSKPHHHHHHHNHHHHVQVKSTTGNLQNEDAHVKCKGQDMGFDAPFQARTKCIMGISNEELTSKHACTSLEKREIGRCCNSFRKECGMHGCMGSGIKGLSDIITEYVKAGLTYLEVKLQCSEVSTSS